MAKKSLSKKTTEKTHQFSVYESVVREKTIGWFLGVLLVFAMVMIASVYTKQYMLGIVILLGAIAYYIMAFTKPNKVQVELSNEGLGFKSKLYSWETLRSFSVWDQKESSVFYIERLSRIIGPLVFTIPKEKSIELQVLLRTVLAEKFHHNSPFDHLVHR